MFVNQYFFCLECAEIYIPQNRRFCLVVVLSCILFPLGGLFPSNGHTWVRHRRFAIATLRNFGMNNNRMERIIQEETTAMLEVIAMKKGDTACVRGDQWPFLAFTDIFKQYDCVSPRQTVQI